jgi:hypothetical protein
MDGASFCPRLIEDDKVDVHLDAPYYWLCPITWLEQAGYKKKSPVIGKSLTAKFIIPGKLATCKIP